MNEIKISEYEKFLKKLVKEDKENFDKLFQLAKNLNEKEVVK